MILSSDADLSISGTYTLSRRNRLTNRKHIQLLFQKGKIWRNFPLKVWYLKKITNQVEHKVLFCVPKRNGNSAVQRNKIKRLLRENYRINKYILDTAIDTAGVKFDFLIGYMYTGTIDKVHYPVVNKAVVESLHYIKNILEIK